MTAEFKFAPLSWQIVCGNPKCAKMSANASLIAGEVPSLRTLAMTKWLKLSTKTKTNVGPMFIRSI